MPCPSCDSKRTLNVTPRRVPKVIRAAVWRAHECQDCGHEFASIQKVASVLEMEAVAEDEWDRRASA